MEGLESVAFQPFCFSRKPWLFNWEMAGKAPALDIN
jgi:hypothetical protein